MKKILIVSFYELKEHFQFISETLKNYMYDIHNYPLFCYAYDESSKIPNYFDHFDEFIKNLNPDIILWWFLDIPNEYIKQIIFNNPQIFYIMYNNDIKDINFVIEKSIYFNLVIATNDIDKNNYIEYNKKHNESNINFKCDIYNSFLDDLYFCKIDLDIIYDVCIILCCEYKNNKQHINSLIYYLNTNNKKYIIFDLFFVNNEKNYNELNKIFNLSKIIFCDIFDHDCISSDISSSTKKLFSDIDMSNLCKKTIYNILLSGNLLMTFEMDKNLTFIDDIIKNNDYICVDKNNMIKNIEDILNDYNNNDIIIKIKKNGKNKMQYLLWNDFGDFLHLKISEHFFDNNFYKLLYGLNYDVDPWNHWLENKKNICYDFDININFDYLKFAYDNDQNFIEKIPIENICNESQCTKNKDILFKQNVIEIKKLYIKWIQEGKSNLYVKKSVKKSLNDFICDMENINLTMEQWFELNVIFDEIRNGETISSGLEKLNIFQKNNDSVDMNKMLNIYVKLCDL